MPAVLKIDPRRRIVCSTFYGEVSDEELLEQRSIIVSDPDFNPSFAEIVDFSGASKTVVSESTLAALAGAESVFDKSVLHIVVAPAQFPFALARKYQALAAETRPNLFVVRSLGEAYKILGVKRKL